MTAITDRLTDPNGQDLQDLVTRCNGGDDRAWERLLAAVRQLALDLGRWRYRLTKEDAEDVAQVVQIRVTQRLGQLRDPVAFPAWIRRLTHHAVVDSLRQRKPALSLDDPESPDLELAARTEEADPYDRIVLRQILEEALSRLPDRYREPIQLHVLQGLPQDDVSRLLGRPRSTVASQIERGLARLQRSLSPSVAVTC